MSWPWSHEIRTSLVCCRASLRPSKNLSIFLPPESDEIHLVRCNDMFRNAVLQVSANAVWRIASRSFTDYYQNTESCLTSMERLLFPIFGGMLEELEFIQCISHYEMQCHVSKTNVESFIQRRLKECKQILDQLLNLHIQVKLGASYLQSLVACLRSVREPG